MHASKSPLRQRVEHGAGVRPATVALELRDDLHRPHLRCAGHGPGGEARAQQVERRDAVAHDAAHLRHEMRDVREALRLHEAHHLHGSRLADAREVVPAEVDEHHVLGAVLLRVEQALGVAFARLGRARDRVERRDVTFPLDERLRRRADQRDAVELQKEEVRRRVDATQRAVERERRHLCSALGALRQDDLECVPALDVLLAPAHAVLVVGLRREALRLVRLEPLLVERGRCREQLRDLVAVAGEYLGRPARMIEAHEPVHRDEPALGQRRPLGGKRDGRLERGDVVVAEVADHRHVEAVRLVEREQPIAVADERMPPEPALLDRFQQEGRAARLAQPQVRGERREQVGVGENGAHAVQGRQNPRRWRRRSFSAISSAPAGRPATRRSPRASGAKPRRSSARSGRTRRARPSSASGRAKALRRSR